MYTDIQTQLPTHNKILILKLMKKVINVCINNNMVVWLYKDLIILNMNIYL